MLRPIYKNYKTGKYFTFKETKDEAGNVIENQIMTVFIDDNIFDASELKVDKNGKAYKLFNVVDHTTKNGYSVLKYKKEEN